MGHTKFTFLICLLSIQIRRSTQICNSNGLDYETPTDCQRRYYYNSPCPQVISTYSIACEEDTIESIKVSGITLKAKTITLNNTTSLTIASSDFIIYPNLMSLTINHGSLNNIHPGAFNGLTNLKELILTNQNITTLPKGVFNSLTALEKLDLSSNFIDVIEKHTFLGMASLKELSLSNNNIDDITELVNVCDKMEVLDLSQNKISDLISFKNFANLRILTLNNNEIINLSGDTFADTNIKKLIISNNLIESIDNNAFAGVVSLEYLNLASNNLWKMQDGTPPVGIFRDNKLLTYLNLSRTGLSKIRIGIFTGLLKLQTLDLSFNELTFLPRGIFHDLGLLNDLYLDHNKLTYFEYDGFGELKKINLNSNPWNCNTLSNITTILRKAEIVRGITYNSTNVYGISCLEELPPQNQSQMMENSTASLQPTLSEGALSQAIIDSYQNFFGDVRKDLKILYEEFSGNFLNTFKEMCSASSRTINSSKHDEDHDVTATLFQSILEKLNSQERTGKEEMTPINRAEQLKSGNLSAQTYGGSASSAVFVCILIVLIVILLVLIFLVYLLIQIKSINEFRKSQVPLLENGRL